MSSRASHEDDGITLTETLQSEGSAPMSFVRLMNFEAQVCQCPRVTEKRSRPTNGTVNREPSHKEIARESIGT